MLFELLLGSPVGPNAPPNPDDRRAAGSVKLRVLIMGYLLRCMCATAMFPTALQAVFLCLNGEGATPRTRVLGMLFIHRLFEFSPQQLMASTGRVIFSTALLKSISSTDTPPELLALSYTAIGKLARRMPELFHDNVDLLARLVTALPAADATVAPAITEALHLLRASYAAPADAAAPALLAVLGTAAASPSPAVRLVAVQYAAEVFGPRHVSGRMLVLERTSDEREDVASEARTSLFRLERPGAAATAPESFPSFEPMLSRVCAQLGSADGTLEDVAKTLPYSASVFGTILIYLRCCLGASADVDENEETHVSRTGRVGARIIAIRDLLTKASADAERNHAKCPVRSYVAVLQTGLVC
jgi:proteasome component ECM29